MTSQRSSVPAVLALVFVASCTPLRGRESKPAPTSPSKGPEIHGEIQVHAGGMAAASGTQARDLSADFEAPPGLAVTLFAESPQVFNPTAMDVDARGRVWVTEAVNYRQWNGRNPGLHRPEGDRVVILEDKDGDGTCDVSKVFVQDKDLVAPLGIAVIGDAKNPKSKKVVVSCSPSIFVYTDENGDDVPDKKEVFLTGFGGHDHDHGVHSVVVGPDGRWYFAVGNAGPHVVMDKGGWTLRSGSIYRGGGESEADNHPSLVSDGGKVWTGGLILRCEPDGTDLTVMAHNFRNEYEVALDSFGNMFTADNDDDGNQCCRTTWVMEGGNYGYFSADGSREWQADRRPGQDVWTAHWHQDDPGVCPAGTRNGAGGPTGVCVYEGDLLGPQWAGVVLDCDAGANCVYAHTPVAKGAGYEMKPGTLLRSKPKAADDPNARWFRPSDVCVETDGSVLVADWWDPGVGGHLAGDKEAYGRILRIAPTGSKLHPPKINLSTVDGAIEALKNPSVHTRALGAAALRSNVRIDASRLEALLSDPSPRIRARALSLLTDASDSIRDRLWNAFADSNPDVRIAALRVERLVATRGLRTHDSTKLHDSGAYSRLLNDPSPGVRREILISSRDPELKGVANNMRSPLGQIPVDRLVATYSGSDRWLLEALGSAVDSIRYKYGTRESAAAKRSLISADESLEQWYNGLRRDQPTDPAAWSPAFADIAWRLHPPVALANLVSRANLATLPSPTRRQSVEAIAFMKEKEAGEAMLNLALAGPDDTRALAAWWIEHNDLDPWREYHLKDQLGTTGLADAEMRWSSGILTSGSAEVDVDVSGAKTVWLVVTDGKLGNGCDWADWIEPAFSGANGDVRLTSLAWTSAQAGWGETRVNLNANGGPLMFGGAVMPDGIGTHARSEIVYRVPDGAARFHALAALDDGGTGQTACHPDVEFQVWTDKRRDPERWKALEKSLVDASAKAEDVDASAKTMSADRDGGLALIHLASTKQLSPAATDSVARYIFANPDLSVRALASEHFARAGAATPLPPVDEIVKLPGSASRGAKIFFGDAARCSTCHAFYGKGGDIGPDLSAITAKYAKPQILDSILNPSAAIAFGYDTFLVETKDGLLENGFILSEGDQVVLRDTSGKRHVIPASEIVSKTKQKVSTMPDNVAMGLATQDIADVLALLTSNPRAAGKNLEKRALFDGKDLAGWTFFLEDPNAKMEDVWSVKDGVLRCKGRPIGYLRTTEDFTSFVLTVDWRFDPAQGAGNSGVLLRMTGADKVWPRSVEAQLNSGDAGDIWNIDAVPAQVDPARTQGRRTVKLAPSSEKPLGEWNRYVITLDGGELTLEVNGVKQNEAQWVEEIPGKICLQSEGAAIEFRKVEIVPIER
ncbi:MAG TPA: PVC-type heme-binding CxxCH protein [Planctomycetota bacterium]|jgi:putative membrane-bound dehydrogenase-like protein|nr:PVC-type heme-binding CxxCH protein [Planctomycetota bacterium]